MDKKKENQLNIEIWKLILAIILVNTTGLCLRYLNFNTYLIIIGFRFHLSFVIPFIVVFNSNFLPFIKSSFIRPVRRNAFFYFALIILPIFIEAGSLYIFQKLELGDPEYFYEFGISSIADYPIYMIWNFPQMVFLYFFLASVSSVSRFKFLTVALVIFLLFVFEFTPMNKSSILYSELGILISCSVICSILINYYRNIYCFGISLFTLLWLAILAFGSNSKTLINVLFASQYSSWEGFFEVVKDYSQITLLVYFVIALIISVVAGSIYFVRNNHKIESNVF